MSSRKCIEIKCKGEKNWLTLWPEQYNILKMKSLFPETTAVLVYRPNSLG
jgi:hypothetical protein